jgi:hypothetical protein
MVVTGGRSNETPPMRIPPLLDLPFVGDFARIFTLTNTL